MYRRAAATCGEASHSETSCDAVVTQAGYRPPSLLLLVPLLDAFTQNDRVKYCYSSGSLDGYR